MTATRLPVLEAVGCATIHPSANARSTIAASAASIVTGELLIPSTHEPSHGAGHRRPANSGKLFGAWSRSIPMRDLQIRRHGHWLECACRRWRSLVVARHDLGELQRGRAPLGQKARAKT